MAQLGNKLAYQPYSSILNPGFWQQLTDVKLNKLKLSTDLIEIKGTYSLGLSSNLCLASFDHGSFSEGVTVESRTACQMYGRLICFNMLQEMIEFDKKQFLQSIGDEIWSSIQDGRALTEPEKHLSKFGLLVFADLKRYKFTYWFTFPALNHPSEVYISNDDLPHQPITNFFNSYALEMLQEQYDKPASDRTFQRGYFIVIHNHQNDQVECLPLHKYNHAIIENREAKIYFAFSEPSPSNQYPGWPLRNYLALISVQFKLKQASIIRLRRGQSTVEHKSEFHHSMVLDVHFEPGTSNQKPLVTGWEKNESMQLAPKRVNLSNLLDPKKLASDAVNLNLRLMKWRLLPGLDLEKIAGTRCLILGCGTLGCHIVRGLLAWGVNHITLVDSSKVSYSNPVRQTLYTLDDCLKKDSDTTSGTGLYKANAAAASLRKIHPNVHVESHVLWIPMPGHHVVQKEIEQTRDTVKKLESLIENHDAIFLLMDTRESRWLPTVISMSKQKLVINAAIGFDTFLLQRFGIRKYGTKINTSTQSPKTSSTEKNPIELESSKLGCYFCNDIVAPSDSTLDRTLDQQCTVSRPGVSMMVSAIAVEFLASIVSSSLGSQTPAPLVTRNDISMMSDNELGSELGIVPHSIRGNVNRYHIFMPTSPFFNKCSACSDTVVINYLEHGFEFLLRVFNEPTYLEEIAGLKDLKNVNDDVLSLDSDEVSND